MKTLLLAVALFTQPLFAATSLTFSGKGYITQGLDYNYDLSNANVIAQVNNSNTDDISFSFITPGYTHWWYVSFRPADGQKLQVGMYNNSVRWHGGDNSKSSFDIFGDGRGSNTVAGWFEVLEIEWNPEHTKVLEFAANFHHLSEGIESRYTDGAIRYNSNIAVPEISSIFMISLSSLGLLRRSRR